DISPTDVSSLTIIGSNCAWLRLLSERSSSIFMVPHSGLVEFVDKVARRSNAVFDGTVHDDAAPTIGPFRAGKPHACAGVQDAMVPVNELPGAQGTKGLTAPLVAVPVVAGTVHDFDVGAPLIYDLLGRFHARQVGQCLVIRAKAHKDRRVVVHEIFGSHQRNFRGVWGIGFHRMVPLGFDYHLAAGRIPAAFGDVAQLLGQLWTE